MLVQPNLWNVVTSMQAKPKKAEERSETYAAAAITYQRCRAFEGMDSNQKKIVKFHFYTTMQKKVVVSKKEITARMKLILNILAQRVFCATKRTYTQFQDPGLIASFSYLNSQRMGENGERREKQRGKRRRRKKPRNTFSQSVRRSVGWLGEQRERSSKSLRQKRQRQRGAVAAAAAAAAGGVCSLSLYSAFSLSLFLSVIAATAAAAAAV